MDAPFSRQDMERLGQTIAIAAGPFEYPTIDDWRTNVVQSCMGLLDGRMAHFDVFGAGLSNPYMFVGYPDGLFRDWSETWSGADTALHATERYKLNVYSRRYRYRVAGEQWTAKYKRSAVYHEFYLKYALGDAASIYFRRGGIRAHLLIETDNMASDAMDERGRTFLSVLHPALQSAILSLANPNGGHWDADGLLNALNEPIAIVGENGHWIHRSTAFEMALDTIPGNERAQFLEAARSRAQALLQSVSAPVASARGRRQGDAGITPLWTQGLFDVCATTIGLSGAGGRSCLIKLSTRSGTTLDQALAAGLTKRECGVAMCLVEGMSNKAIAHRLSISEHTARRHTESILRKLRVTNRGSVGFALRDGSEARAT